MPLSNYANSNYDQLTAGGKTVGVSLFSGYSYNERSFLSLATVDEDVAIGNEVVLHWGEPNGGTGKTTVERHKQTEIRAIVSRCRTPRLRAPRTPMAGARRPGSSDPRRRGRSRVAGAWCAP